MKKKNVLKWIILTIAAAINVFILVNAFINGETSAKESNTVATGAAEVINTFKPGTITEDNFQGFALDIRKLFGHFGLFGASGLFSTWALYLFVKDTKMSYFGYQVGSTLVFGFVMACVSEFAQKFTEGRYGSWIDVGIDMGGYFAGVLLVFLILLIRKSPIFLTSKQKENRAN